MTGLARLVVVLVAIVGPARLARALPPGPDRPARARIVAAGAAAGAAVALLLAALSGPLLDLLDITPVTFRIGAGGVVAIGGAVAVVRGTRPWEGVGPGLRAALVPVAFPIVLSPELVAAAVSLGADEGAANTGVAIVAAAAVSALVAVMARPGTDRILVGVERLAGATALIVGIALAVTGILDT